MATKKPNSQEQKRDLRKLREKGLYKPKDARAAPTSYGKKMLRKFADVLQGRATVLTVPKTKRSKGYKTARDNAEPGLGVYSVKNKIVVPHAKGERVSWSKKEKKYHVTRRSDDGGTLYIRKPLGRKISKPDQLKLKSGERVAVPFNRPGRGIDWMYLTEEEFREVWTQYHDRQKNPYSTLGNELQILTVKQRGGLDEDDFENDEVTIFQREPDSFTPTSAARRSKRKRRRKKI